MPKRPPACHSFFTGAKYFGVAFSKVRSATYRRPDERQGSHAITGRRHPCSNAVRAVSGGGSREGGVGSAGSGEGAGQCTRNAAQRLSAGPPRELGVGEDHDESQRKWLTSILLGTICPCVEQ